MLSSTADGAVTSTTLAAIKYVFSLAAPPFMLHAWIAFADVLHAAIRRFRLPTAR
jgi:hypothetical protein